MRTALIVHGLDPVNAVVLPPDDASAAAYLSAFDGTCVVPDPEDDYGTAFVRLTGCVMVEVTGMDPMPGVGNGWTFVNGEWVAPESLSEAV